MSPRAVGDDEGLVTLVLYEPSGQVPGQLPSSTGSPRYWSEAEHVVSIARSRFGTGIIVLQLLTTENRYAGGAVSYFAQVALASRACGGFRLRHCLPVSRVRQWGHD